MCGRYVQASSPALLASHFGVEEVRIEAAEPSYNVTPRAEMPVVATSRRDDGNVRVLDRIRWGLVPSWAKDPKIGDRQINARAETVATKPAYRKAFERRRCIVPADGFYEWQVVERADAAEPGTAQRGSHVKGSKKKQPWFIHRVDGEPLAFAGLWERWDDGLRTFTIITTDANKTMSHIHHRMPVVLLASEWDRWLDPDFRDTAALQALLVPAAEDVVEAWPVSYLVNKPDNNTAENTARVEIASAP